MHRQVYKASAYAQYLFASLYLSVTHSDMRLDIDDSLTQPWLFIPDGIHNDRCRGENNLSYSSPSILPMLLQHTPLSLSFLQSLSSSLTLPQHLGASGSIQLGKGLCFHTSH